MIQNRSLWGLLLNQLPDPDLREFLKARSDHRPRVVYFSGVPILGYMRYAVLSFSWQERNSILQRLIVFWGLRENTLFLFRQGDFTVESMSIDNWFAWFRDFENDIYERQLNEWDDSSVEASYKVLKHLEGQTIRGTLHGIWDRLRHR